MTVEGSVDAIIQTLKLAFIGELVHAAANANVAGQVTAYSALRIPISFNLINQEAVIAARAYRNLLIEKGGSMVTQLDAAGNAHRIFVPWLKDSLAADRDQIIQIIEHGIKEGTPLKQIKQSLDEVFAMRKHNAKLTAYQETKALFNEGTMKRFEDEAVEEGTWRHMDPQTDPRPEHQDLNGQIFPLNDSVWYELELPNCHCYCEPVIKSYITGGNE